MIKKLPKKEICKWHRGDVEEALPLLVMQIRHAQYLCRKCGRAAADKELLCKAVKIKAIAEVGTDAEGDA